MHVLWIFIHIWVFTFKFFFCSWLLKIFHVFLTSTADNRRHNMYVYCILYIDLCISIKTIKIIFLWEQSLVLLFIYENWVCLLIYIYYFFFADGFFGLCNKPIWLWFDDVWFFGTFLNTLTDKETWSNRLLFLIRNRSCKVDKKLVKKIRRKIAGALNRLSRKTI